MQQLRSLADHGHAEARELLALRLSVDQVSNVSTPTQMSLFAGLARWFWAQTESLYEGWSKDGQNSGI